MFPEDGAYAFGEEFPTLGEVPVSWQTWSDGAGGIPTTVGDSDWGQLKLELNDEGRSAVYTFPSASLKNIIVSLDRYQSGSGTATTQIRGHATTSFNQDDVSPSWETYNGTVHKGWKYIQVRVIKNA